MGKLRAQTTSCVAECSIFTGYILSWSPGPGQMAGTASWSLFSSALGWATEGGEVQWPIRPEAQVRGGEKLGRTKALVDRCRW